MVNSLQFFVTLGKDAKSPQTAIGTDKRGTIVDPSERRRAERFQGAIPVELKDGRGLTCDYSTHGIYFETDQSLSLGQKLVFTMHLNYPNPAWPMNPPRPSRLRCLGEVVRVEPGLEKIGAAVKMECYYELR